MPEPVSIPAADTPPSPALAAAARGGALAPAPAASKAFDMVPTTFAEAREFAEFIAKSSLVPKEFRNNAADVFVAVQMGLDLGLRPMQALQNIAVINGKPVVYGDAVLAIVRANASFEWIDEKTSDDFETAYCTVKRRGQDPVTRMFSVDDAKRAKLLNKAGPWQEYPRRMLQMRARSWALRDVFPDALRGIGIGEEFEGVTARESASGETIEHGATAADPAADVAASLNAQLAAPAARQGAVTDEHDSAAVETPNAHQLVELTRLIDEHDLGEHTERIKAWMDKSWGVDDFKSLTHSQCDELLERLPDFAERIAIERETDADEASGSAA